MKWSCKPNRKGLQSTEYILKREVSWEIKLKYKVLRGYFSCENTVICVLDNYEYTIFPLTNIIEFVTNCRVSCFSLY